MNVSQTNHTPQQNPAGDPSLAVSDQPANEAFLNQLTLAQQGPEWFTETDVKSEKERVTEEQQTRLKESEELEDDLIASLTSQGYVNNLKQADVQETARVIAASENRDRLTQHIEQKHLHTPTIVEEGDINKAENSFSKLMAGETEGGKGASQKESGLNTARLDGDDPAKSTRASQLKSTATSNNETLQRFDANLAGNMKQALAGKTSQMSEKALSALSKLNAADGATGKSAAKNASSRVMSFSALSENMAENQKAEAGLKAAGRTAKTATPVNIEDVMGKVKIMISSKTNEMVMKLNPEHLGKLEIKLRKEGDKLIGRFKVDSLQAKEAIEMQLPQLKEGLAEQGVHVEEFSVSVNGEDASNQSFAFNQDPEGGTGQSQRSKSVERKSDSGTPMTGTSAGVSGDNASGLNIYA